MRIVFFLLICLFYFSSNVNAQGDWLVIHTFKTSTNKNIIIKVKKAILTCDQVTETRRMTNQISIQNSESLAQDIKNKKIGEYLSWEFLTTSCSGVEQIIPININLNDYATGGIDLKVLDKSFEAKDFELIIGSVKNEKNLAKARKVQSNPLKNAIILGPAKVVEGDSITLSINGVVSLVGTKFIWKKGSCDGEVILGQESNTLKVKVGDKSVTYFAKLINGIYTNCISKDITVLTNSKKANRIIANSPICPPNRLDSLLMTVEGGFLGEDYKGNKAKWVWHENNENGKIIGEGVSIKIASPEKKTSYFVRPEGVSSPFNIPSVSKTIEIKAFPQVPKVKIDGPTTAYSGQLIELKLKGDNLKDFQITWSKLFMGENYSGPISISAINNGVKEIIEKNTQYTLTIKGDCGVIDQKIHNISIESPIEVNKPDPPKAMTGAYLKPYRPPKGIFDDSGSYYFGSLGISASESNNLSTKVFTLGRFKEDQFGIYIRTKQSFNSSEIGDYKQLSLQNDLKEVINFPINSGNYYVFNGEKLNTRSSYTVGVILGNRNIKGFFGLGYGSQNYYNGLDVSTYQSSSLPVKTWSKNINYSNSGIEFEAGVTVKIKSFLLMAGTSYLMGTAPAKGYISVDLNVGYAIEL